MLFVGYLNFLVELGGTYVGYLHFLFSLYQVFLFDSDGGEN